MLSPSVSITCRVILITLLLSFAAAVSAQTPLLEAPSNDITGSWRWRSFPEFKNTRLIQLSCSPDGTVWGFSNGKGIIRYDGLKQTIFADGFVGPGKKIKDVFVANDGTVYVATKHGLVRYDDGKWVDVLPGEGILSWDISEISDAEDGSLWATTYNGFLHVRSPLAGPDQSDCTFYTIAEYAKVYEKLLPTLRLIEVPAEFGTTKDSLKNQSGMVASPSAFALPAYIQLVAPGSPAGEAGLRHGDYIESAYVVENGERKYISDSYEDYFGTTVTFTVRRAGVSNTFKVIVNLPKIKRGVRAPWIVPGHFEPHEIVEGKDGKMWFTFGRGKVGCMSANERERDVLEEASDKGLDKQDVTIFDQESGIEWRLYEVGTSPGRISVAQDGAIWVTQETKNKNETDPDPCVLRFDGSNWESWSKQDLGIKGRPRTLFAGRNGLLVTGSLDGAICIYDKGVWTTRYAAELLRLKGNLNINRIAKGANDSVWFSSSSGGLFRFDYGGAERIAYKNCRFMLESSDGSRWFLDSGDTLLQETNGEWLKHSGRSGMRGKTLVLLESSSETVWNLSRASSTVFLGYLDGTGWHQQAFGKPGRGWFPAWLYEDNNGALWFPVADDMICRFMPSQAATHGVDDTSNRQLYSLPDGLKEVSCFAEDKNGNYLAASKKALFRFDGEDWSPHRLLANTTANVTTIHSGHDGILWFGTGSQGVIRYDGETWTDYQVEDGLPSNHVYSVLQTGPETVWAMTEAGLAHLEGDYWGSNAAWASNPLPKIFLPSRERIILQPSRDRTFWLNVLGVEENGRIRRNLWALSCNFEKDPPVTDVSQAVRVVSSAGNATFSWAGLDPWSSTQKESLNYSWRLDGDKWSPYSKDTTKSFFSLPSGQHVLEVRARDRAFNVDPTAAVLGFAVQPPIWMQVWFQSLVGALLSGIILLTYRVGLSTRRLRVANVELNEARDELEHRVELRTSDLAFATERLRESEKLHRTILENAFDGINVSVRDKKTGKRRLESCNDRYVEMSGFTREQLFDADDLEELSDCVHVAQRVAVSPGVFRFFGQCSWKRPDGKENYYEWNATVFSSEEEDRFFGVDRDVTARIRLERHERELEAQMQHAQKLESLGVLAGGIAHDFNNLLMTILGNAELSLMEVSKVSPARDTIKEIITATGRAAELCRQMLAYSGKGKFVVETINLNEVIEEMGHLLEISISKGAVVKRNFESELPLISADVTQLRQVIMNLITNASDAIGEQDGVISMSTGSIRCDKEYLNANYYDEDLEEGDYVFLEVSDTGCGMDAKVKEKVFDPFFTTKFTGRGLGMAAVLGIVRGHKGAIRLYSEVGQGTTFKLLFPVACGQLPDRMSTPKKAEKWHGKGTVLLVDDEEGVRKVAKKMLERFGMTVILAENGVEALEICRDNQNNIDCVLLDLTMPKMGGEETFRELRKIRSDIPVVIASGYTEQDVASRFSGKELAGFIQKPYRLESLLNAIRGVLGDGDEGDAQGL